MKVWRVGPITYVFERCFAALDYLSVARHLFGSRTRFQRGELYTRRGHTTRRMLQIDLYVIVLLVLELLSGAVATRPGIRILAAMIAVYRILEIFQVSVNVGLLDALRLRGRPHLVASRERMVVLAFVNFVELVLCFAVLYMTVPDGLVHLGDSGAPGSTWWAAHYFSLLTQTLVGAPDMAAQGWARLVLAGQAAVAVVFAIVTLSRFVSLLPPVQEMYESEDD